jgi:ABC-2 type transport system ATP-binding protein
VIEVEDLRHVFAKPVLQGISFRVAPGEVVGYLGPNGSGKTTTIRILAGMLRPTSGRVRVLGFDPAEQPIEVKSRIGYVPESGALYETLTPVEYLALVGGIHGLTPDLVRDRTHGFLKAFGLEGQAQDRMTSFSKGMKQKVVIAAALIHDPQVLFLDEPLNGLDANATVTVKEVIHGFVKRGRAVFYSSHLMDVVERVTSRVIVLHEGRIAAEGNPDELCERAGVPDLESLFLRLTASDDVRGRAADILGALGSAPEAAPNP